MKKNPLYLLTALSLALFLSLLNVGVALAAPGDCADGGAEAPITSGETDDGGGQAQAEGPDGDGCDDAGGDALPADGSNDGGEGETTAEADEGDAAAADGDVGDGEPSPTDNKDGGGEVDAAGGGEGEVPPTDAGAESSDETASVNGGDDETTDADPIDGHDGEPAITQDGGGSGDSAENSATLLPPVPEDVSVLVLNQDGEAVALGTQEAAEILAAPDPQFCPAGLSFGDPGCSPVRVTIGEAVNDAGLAIGGGTVFVEGGTYAENVTIAGFTSDLTLLGMLGSGSTIIEGSVSIDENSADITVEGFSIFDPANGIGVAAFNNTGTLTLTDLVVETGGSDGILITGDDGHDGDVVLTDVDTSDTGGNGTNIDAHGSVEVNSSSFNGNTDAGLLVEAYAAITLTEVSASNNGGSGAVLATEGNVAVLKGTFNGNYGDGLLISTNGGVTLEGITANGNGQAANDPSCDPAFQFCGGHGINIEEAQEDVVVDNSSFNGNASTGLRIDTFGDIILSDVTASGNGGAGVGTCNFDPDTDRCLDAGAVTLEDVTANDNFNAGLGIFSSADVTLENVTANANGRSRSDPACNPEFQFCGGSGAFIGAQGRVVVDSGTFNGNANAGLGINTPGNIKLEDVRASGNGNFGVDICVFDPVSGECLDAGDVTLKDVTANNNGQSRSDPNCDPEVEFCGGGGAFMEAQGRVVVDSGTFNDNAEFGLGIDTPGTIKLEDVTANGNGNSGVDTCNFDPNVDRCLGAGDVTLKGVTANNNFHHGLGIVSTAGVRLEEVTANNNGQSRNDPDCDPEFQFCGGEGAFIEAQGRVVVDSGTFNDNAHGGLVIATLGKINLEDVTASRNHGGGGVNTCNFDPDTNRCLGAGDVTLEDVTANVNFHHGLEIVSTAGVSLEDVTANNNGQAANDPDCNPEFEFCGGGGASIEAQGQVVVDAGTFNDNAENGLNINTPGKIKLSEVSASGNGNNGFDTCRFDPNTDRCLGAGDVTLEEVTASNNGQAANDPDCNPEIQFCGGSGASIEAQGQVVVDASMFNDNAENGLNINTPGKLTLSEVSASGNGNNGVDTCRFDPDTDRCLGAGDVTLEEVTANNNGQSRNDPDCVPEFEFCGGGGASIAAQGRVVVDSSSFSDNADAGLWINTPGKIELSEVSASGNGGVGVDTCNHDPELDRCLGAGSLTLEEVVANNNYSDGLGLVSASWAKLEDVTANRNGRGRSDPDCDPEFQACTGSGASISAQSWVKVESGTFRNNTDTGLSFHASGDIKLEDVIASGNGNHGIEICNFDPEIEDCAGAAEVTFEDVWANNNGQSINDPDCDPDIEFCGGGGAFVAAQGRVSIEDGRFNDNADLGLQIDTPGSIKLEEVTASRNGGAGLDTCNHDPETDHCLGAGAVTLEEVTASENLSDGLRIFTSSSAKLEEVTANNNGQSRHDPNCDPEVEGCGGSGMWINARGTLTLIGVTANHNGNNGVDICNFNPDSGRCLGAETLKLENVTANDNFNSGLTIVSASWAKLDDVTANNNGQAQHDPDCDPEFQDCGGSGMWINARGSVKLTRVTANRNGNNGVDICNFDPDSGRCLGAETLKLENVTANDNFNFGLTIVSASWAKLDDVTANNNGQARDDPDCDPEFQFCGGDGALIEAQDLVVVESSTFNDNANTGLVIRTPGQVELEEVTASGNGGAGVDTCNHDPELERCLGAGAVSLEKVRANFNYNDGLSIVSASRAKLDEVTANNNGQARHDPDCNPEFQHCGGNGAFIRAQSWVFVEDSAFNSNAGTGLGIDTPGRIILEEVTASGNGNNGIEICNFDPDTGRCLGPEDVTLEDVTANNNYNFGMGIHSSGWVKLEEVTASNNGQSRLDPACDPAVDFCDGEGAFVEAQDRVVVISSTFNDNANTGLRISTPGEINLSEVMASRNGGGGAIVTCYFEPVSGECLGSGAVTISGTFNGNLHHGLEIVSSAGVTLEAVTANNNGQARNDPDCNPEFQFCGGNGAFIAAQGPVVVESSTFNGNADNGLEINTPGTIKLSEVTASGNGESGAFLVTSAGDGNIDVSCSIFQLNGFLGIGADAGQGTMTLNSVTGGNNNVDDRPESDIPGPFVGDFPDFILLEPGTLLTNTIDC